MAPRASPLRSTVIPSSARRSRAEGVASSQPPGAPDARVDVDAVRRARRLRGAGRDPDAERVDADAGVHVDAAGGSGRHVERAAHAERDVRRRRRARGAAGERREGVRHALERALAEEAADRDRGDAGDLARAVGAREALERVAQSNRGTSARVGLPAVEQVGQVRHRVGERPVLAGALQHEPRGAQRLGGVGAATTLSGAPPCGVPSVIRPATNVGFAAANARAARPAVECATRITGRPPRSSRIRATTAATCAVTTSSSPPASARSAV